MTVAVGVDVVDLERFESVMTRQKTFLDRVFTPDEREYCDRAKALSVRCQRYAARFAAKEAVMKALGCGLGAYGFHDVAVTRDDSGEPTLLVKGKAAVLADERGITQWLVSLSHTDLVAMALVVAD
ncbi:MAG: holo-[acyl-carrier protein] synthase [Acidimicrobiaceae bacterium]|jgi:holo-[acyl-carrier protein] synthase